MDIFNTVILSIGIITAGYAILCLIVLFFFSNEDEIRVTGKEITEYLTCHVPPPTLL